MSVVIFTGPTVSPAEVRQVLEADCLPPVAQGDVYRAALRRPRAIGIIDGYFEHVPSVWHKEILWAMHQGIYVFGSASMGALRAAELTPFGMVGIGVIFEEFRDGVLEDDDEVAVAHGPTEDSFRFSTEPMVNIRASLVKAEAEGIIGPEARRKVLGVAKALFYPERTWANILEKSPDEALRQWLPQGRVNQKRDDALAMLRAMRDFLATGPGPMEVSYVMEEALHWQAFVRAAREIPFEQEADRLVLDELNRDPRSLARAEAAALGWMLASAQDRRQNRLPEASSLLELSREFCSLHGIDGPEGAAHWRRQNLCTDEILEHLLQLRESALAAQSRSPDALAVCLLEFLRWTGDYPVLLDRARQANKP